MENPKLKALSEEWLVEATVEDMQSKMEAGEITARDLTLMYLHRIARYDSAGIKLNSIIEINPEALHIAERLDAERKRKGPRGPLHGIPVLLKDNVDTADKMHTTAGSLAMANHYAKQDAFVAQKLREAGAILLGKTNMTEWANFMADKMPSGYSSRGGQTLNAYRRGKGTPGGSSTGSGVAVAANLAALSVGTETDGSILSPAFHNCIVGLKTTIGLISRAGIIPIAHSQDSAGPMARTVRDTAILLGAMAGADERDPVSFVGEGQGHEDYTVFLDEQGLQGARIGISRRYLHKLEADAQELFEAALEVLRREGATLVEVESPTDEDNWQSVVLTYEFKPDLNAYLATCGPHVPVHTLAELIHFNNVHAEQSLQYGQAQLIRSEKTSGMLTEREYIQSRERDLYRAQHGIDAMLDGQELDAWIYVGSWESTKPAQAGYPSISVPAGFAARGPFGITFSGRAFSEPTLLKLAYAFEQATKHRKPPRM